MIISDTEIQALLNNDPDNAESLPMLVRRWQAERSSVIPFVGAGLSKDFGFPLWGDFLLNACGNRPALRQRIQDRIAANQYEDAASDLAEELGPLIFQNKVSETFNDSTIGKRPIDGPAALLTEFPVAQVITTNFDRVIETAFNERQIPMTPILGSKIEYDVEALQQGKPFLLKLHGDWADCDNRVLTLEEYEKAYGNSTPDATDWSRPLPELLKLLLTTRCLLFLGCSLQQDRTMQVLSQVAQRFANRIYHFGIVQRPAAKEMVGVRRKQLQSMSIIPIWYPYGSHQLVEKIIQYLVAKMEESFPSTRRDVVIPGTPTPIIGREKDIENVMRELRTTRLLTILGPGGCGKSRLSEEVAKAVRLDFPNGVWFIPLSELSLTPREENPVPSEVGKVIGVKERPKHPPNEALIDHLSNRTCLLILDNCEHLLKWCREFAVELLKACPRLKVLTTSRVVLAPQFENDDEFVYELEPLDTPAPEEAALEQVRESSAVQMLVEWVRRRNRRFQLTPENASAVAGVCRSVAGLPLAIKITAARLTTESIESLWEEVCRGDAAFLDKGSEGHTMRATIDRSYKLLQPEAQTFLRQLSVFRGGWTEKAAAVICRPGAPAASSSELITLLVDSSLLETQTVNAKMRFSFLEPVRQFLLQEITPAEAVAVSRAHAEWFSILAESAYPKLTTTRMDETLKCLQIEVDNFRVAVRWVIEQHQPECGLRLMANLWHFTEIRAYYTDGFAWAEEVLRIPGTLDFPELRCKLLAGAGMLAYRMARFLDSKALFQECLDIASSRNDSVWMAEAMGDLGLVAVMRGDFKEAEVKQRECKRLEQLNGNAVAVANADFNLGFLALGAGRYGEAEGTLQDALKEFRANGNERGEAFALNSLACCRIIAGDFETAAKHSTRALEIRRKSGDEKCVADTLRTSAWAAIEVGRRSDAVAQLKGAITKAHGVDDSRGVSEALDLFAILGARCNLFKGIVELAAAAKQTRGPYGYALPPALVAEREDALAQAKEHLGELEYSRAWDRGSILSVAAALDAALEFAGRTETA